VISSLVLPTVSLTLIDAIRQYEKDNDMKKTLRNAFLPESGLFFLIYVLQAGFIGGSVDLLRLSETLGALTSRKRPASPEEAKLMSRKVPFGFQVELPLMISVLAVTLTYSLFTPLILPAGLFYFVVKHLVDQHHLAQKGLDAQMEPVRVMALSTLKKRLSLLTRLMLACLLIFEIYAFYFFSIRQLFGQSTFIFVVLLSTTAFVLAWYFGVLRWTRLDILEAKPLLTTEAPIDIRQHAQSYVAPDIVCFAPYGSETAPLNYPPQSLLSYR
jgi:hypothetical protein